jgi:hypothetical protein
LDTAQTHERGDRSARLEEKTMPNDTGPSEMTCPRCGTIQPPAQRCRECGMLMVRNRPRPVLKGRARALAAAGSQRRRHNRYLRWSAWLVAMTAFAVISPMAYRMWLDTATAPGEVATITAALQAQYPRLLELETEDPQTWSRLRGEIALGLESGVPRGEVLARAMALLRDMLQAQGGDIAALQRAPDDAGRASTSPTIIPDDGSSMDLGELSSAIGVSRLRTRKCSGTGPDAECIEQFEDLDAVLGRQDGKPLDKADARQRIDAFRRKAAQYYEALDEL